MKTAIVTGSGGLVGSESVRHLVRCGFRVLGLENDMRASFFGPAASTGHVTRRLVDEYPDEFEWHGLDIRDADGVMGLFARHARDIELVVHAAAQPSHDWAASDPLTDFTVNANGTLGLLEAARTHCLDATFIFLSTNKVYGDAPNRLPLIELDSRLELPQDHPWYRGVDTDMSIDHCMHSLFGVSKAAADLMVQEYGRYFDMPTVCFRCGCLTGPSHAGAKLHGFLSYLMRCTITGEPYTVFGYGGKQVRDNIHSADLVRAFDAFHRSPRRAAVYNLGGGAREQLLDARGNRPLRAGGWAPARVGLQRPRPDGRPPLVDRRPEWLQVRLPRLGHRLRPREGRARDPRRQRRAMELRDRMRLSVVIPAHNEADSIRATVTGAAERLQREGIDYEILVIDDASADQTSAIVESISESDPNVRCVRSHYKNGFGLAVRAGLDRFEGDAVAIMMADASDSPDDLILYYRLFEQGYDCAFGSRFVPGAHVRDYPRFKLVVNRVVNLGIRALFRHGYNDTTNAFKAYRREVVDTIQPLLSNHFNLTVEMPLKAIIRGHSFAVVPISWTNRKAGESKLSLQEMGSRYPFIVLYAFLEQHLSRGDYRHAGFREASRPGVRGMLGRRAQRRAVGSAGRSDSA